MPEHHESLALATPSKMRRPNPRSVMRIVNAALIFLHAPPCADGACTAGHFIQLNDLATAAVSFVGSTNISEVPMALGCLQLCSAKATCRSLYHDAAARQCYLHDVRAEYASNGSATSWTYMAWTAKCEELGECGNAALCPSLATDRTVYSGCADAKKRSKTGTALSGVYFIDPDGEGDFPVWCLFSSDGAWTVFQRRFDGSVDFYRGWNAYKYGFGNIIGEYWLGGDNLYRLTNRTKPRMNILLQDSEGNKKTANYSHISVANEKDLYRLSLGDFTGSAVDSMSLHSANMPFSTYDADNDLANFSCATQFHGAWWYDGKNGECYQCNLNGGYLRSNISTNADGMEWYQWKGPYYSPLKASYMRILL